MLASRRDDGGGLRLGVSHSEAALLIVGDDALEILSWALSLAGARWRIELAGKSREPGKQLEPLENRRALKVYTDPARTTGKAKMGVPVETFNADLLFSFSGKSRPGGRGQTFVEIMRVERTSLGGRVVCQSLSNGAGARRGFRMNAGSSLY